MLIFFIFLTIFLVLVIFAQQWRLKKLEGEIIECFKIQKIKFEKNQHSMWKEIQKLWDVAEDYELHRTNSKFNN
jgi:hypothetical protein